MSSVDRQSVTVTVNDVVVGSWFADAERIPLLGWRDRSKLRPGEIVESADGRYRLTCWSIRASSAAVARRIVKTLHKDGYR